MSDPIATLSMLSLLTAGCGLIVLIDGIVRLRQTRKPLMLIVGVALLIIALVLAKMAGDVSAAV